MVMRLMPFKRAGAPRGTNLPESPGSQAPVSAQGNARRRWQPRLIFLLGAMALLFLLAVGCSTGKQSTWDPVGPVAGKQLELFNVLLWVMVAVFVLVEGILLYAIVRFRYQPGREASRTHGHLPLEIAWTIIPTILVMGLGIWSVVTLFDIEDPPSSETNVLDVRVTGHQWWFEFEYLNEQGETTITTANELRIPVDRAVKLFLNSDDVIHSFWVPKLAGKLDMIPTRTNEMWFKADSDKIDILPATFYGQCAELCGVAHAQMRFRVKVLSVEDFDAWVENWGPPEPLTAKAEQGKATFAANCAICHTITGKDDPAYTKVLIDSFLAGKPGEASLAPAPNLTDLRTRQTLGAGLVELNAENLRIWLNNPDDIKPGNRMAERAFFYQKGNAPLSEEQIDGLIEYLLQLQ